ncbi:Histone-lysine N-methyltransferase ATXR2 [Vitis vinifera]|uniref:Histone-lysine N-methyltransferase ATXR2 n=1 Tax=Vitis vinifera TaxID=29760 RepID=A0A438CQM6_VITVI|nr:Histone-lysine N-methyltransferase ATXR2 [Vitis vinifera]
MVDHVLHRSRVIFFLEQSGDVVLNETFPLELAWILCGDLVVASPVEDYFLYIDDLPYPEKKRLRKSHANFWMLLVMIIQFLVKDRDGQATIIALRPIFKEEEVTISYIDEDLPFDERQALLADYGFRCKCPKCLEEEP